jgi:hypothetical protein
MKKLLFLLPVLFLLPFQNIKGQAFQKGNFNIDLGIGFGAYKTTTKFQFDFFGSPITITEEDGAASAMIPLSLEYGISNKFGLGLEFGACNYAIDDSTEDVNGTMIENNTESVKSRDVLLFCNFHLLDAEKNDLFIGLGIGSSSVVWTFKDNSTYEYSGRGGLFKLYIKDRLFFGEHVGMLFNLGYTSYVYNDMKTSDNNAILEGLKWNVRGLNMGVGLALKF